MSDTSGYLATSTLGVRYAGWQAVFDEARQEVALMQPEGKYVDPFPLSDCL